MTPPFIDFHTHRNCNDGLSVCSYSVGVDITSAEVPPTEPFSAGIHPWDIDTIDTEKSIKLLEELTPQAIGEMGLDYSCGVDREEQKQILNGQLTIATSKSLPVVIHCVKAFDDVISILEQHKGLKRVALHGFVGSKEQVVKAMSAGYYISYGERSFASPKTVEAMSATALSRLFLETDNSGGDIKEVYSHAASILGLSIDRLCDQIYSNYKTFFE